MTVLIDLGKGGDKEIDQYSIRFPISFPDIYKSISVLLIYVCYGKNTLIVYEIGYTC